VEGKGGCSLCGGGVTQSDRAEIAFKTQKFAGASAPDSEEGG